MPDALAHLRSNQDKYGFHITEIWVKNCQGKPTATPCFPCKLGNGPPPASLQGSGHLQCGAGYEHHRAMPQHFLHQLCLHAPNGQLPPNASGVWWMGLIHAGDKRKTNDKGRPKARLIVVGLLPVHLPVPGTIKSPCLSTKVACHWCLHMRCSTLHILESCSVVHTPTYRCSRCNPFENLGHTTRNLNWSAQGQALPPAAQAAARLEQLEEASETQVSAYGGHSTSHLKSPYQGSSQFVNSIRNKFW